MKLVVALDRPSGVAENLELAQKLAELPEALHPMIGLKVGLRLFIRAGQEVVRELLKLPFEVTLDLKLDDIENTLVGAASEITDLGVHQFTVKCSAGPRALWAAKSALGGRSDPPKMLGVTVLTSFDDKACQRVFNKNVKGKFWDFVEDAAGTCDGIVCSPLDLFMVPEILALKYAKQGPTPSLIMFVPGIELKPRKDDQQRKGSIYDALKGGASHIVVGRPIYDNDNPLPMVEKILSKITALSALLAKIEFEKEWE